MTAPTVQLVRLDIGGEARWAARTQVGDAPLRVGLDDLPGIGTLPNPVVLVGRDLDQEQP